MSWLSSVFRSSLAANCQVFRVVFPGGKAPIRFGGRAFFPATPLLGEGLEVTFPFGEPATERFSVGKAPGVPEGFAPSRLGGTSFFPATAAFGELPGVTVFGERTLGFNKLGGVFCPATAAGDPDAPGDPVTCPLSPICGLAKGVGSGKSFGCGILFSDRPFKLLRVLRLHALPSFFDLRICESDFAPAARVLLAT